MSRNSQETAGLVTFAEEVLGGKLHFFCNVYAYALNIIHHEITNSKEKHITQILKFQNQSQVKTKTNF